MIFFLVIDGFCRDRNFREKKKIKLGKLRVRNWFDSQTDVPKFITTAFIFIASRKWPSAGDIYI